MSDFNGMEELLQDFLTESGELLSDVDNKLVELEKYPEDKGLLNDIFRGFHTIKGGAGFLNATPLVTLCHRTENLFDKLRNGELQLNSHVMDVILDATGVVRDMFGDLAQSRMPAPAPQHILDNLDAMLAGQDMVRTVPGLPAVPDPASVSQPVSPPPAASTVAVQAGPATTAAAQPPERERNISGNQQETTLRVDAQRLDQVLNLSGEIGLTKNRLTTIRTEIMQGNLGADVLHSLDEAVSQLDLLVGDLQNAVMKTRMQPIGRLFQKYPRLARDLARQLGKDVDLVLSGEETELDKTMIEDLNDPLVHLVRNAVDHGIETPDERLAAGKPVQSAVKLSAQQVGDHIVIEVADDGRGMNAGMLRKKALEKGLIDLEQANSMDDKQALHLIFLPGFTTKSEISSVSGRGVGMDVVRTNIQKLNGRIDISSAPNEGTRISISLPLTLAILPVLVARVCDQSFAMPLAMVREIIPIAADAIQEVSGRPTIVVRDEVLPVRRLTELLGWKSDREPGFGILMQLAEKTFILAVDTFVGREDVVIKSLQNVSLKGVAGATLSGDGAVVLVLDMDSLLNADKAHAAVHGALTPLPA
ncbi:chemotaxis protein CheA [Laribacter hongkongensis]|uniref:Chemotaxis protein CheA n=1 Tax=Laribacter hongkongensis TaxID=168471 RepID=A0ABD4SUR2_9NEIS|nr:chemotaxis protein CheA [Laribacter hongkongensis]MCG9026967.1 chemotaxis protein CheA [Laribacter hongkongensis]MCG9101740.1 chemotaxis protein CheA [Laribacter hongkongensis]MCG9104522.1 chemotaxis protein CheA [Laribacter hongkongensis]MCG9113602.1 chemotaxis protein CheA [Laribacter hongkongensis]MCG9119898.1 chemotaxis protein CheA [Laribacter hongkongensis]